MARSMGESSFFRHASMSGRCSMMKDSCPRVAVLMMSESETDVDLEKLARELAALEPWERLA